MAVTERQEDALPLFVSHDAHCATWISLCGYWKFAYMKVVIPVAGAGTRLRPHTYTQPKPLMPVAGKPIIRFIVDKLTEVGIHDFVFVIGYLGDKIRDYVERTYPHLRTEFVYQEHREGSAHAIATARRGPIVWRKSTGRSMKRKPAPAAFPGTFSGRRTAGFTSPSSPEPRTRETMNFHPVIPFRGHPARRFHALAEARRQRTRALIQSAAGLAGIAAGLWYLSGIL